MSKIYQANGQTLVEQYRDVGYLFKNTIQESVIKIGKSRSKLLKIRRKVAESTWQNLAKKRECHEFIQCFVAWCEGALITPEQGMWLLADNLSGCQTVVACYASGVALLHTEEEFRDANHMELHMTSPNTISFRDGGETLTTLVYNNLLPGSGLYGWRRDKIVAVDSIFLKEDGIDSVRNPLLANIVAWMVWKMKPEEADPERIVGLVKSMGELVDGYVINVVRKFGSRIEGYKLILARAEHRIEYLGEENGNYLRQVNIIDPSEAVMKWALPPRNIWRGGWKYFRDRVKTLRKHAKQYGEVCNRSLDFDNLETVHRLIQTKVYGELAEYYVHADLGAVCIGFVDKQTGTSVSCKINNCEDLDTIEYLDLVNP